MASAAPAFVPRRLREALAAFYVGVSEATFRRKVQEGSYPPGQREGGMVFWLKDDLDRMIDRQFGIQSESNEEDPFLARFGAAT
jgi:predicted DNA-binding transcriptional regulator AlpA